MTEPSGDDRDRDPTAQNPFDDAGKGQSWAGPVYGAPGTGPGWTGASYPPPQQPYYGSPPYSSGNPSATNNPPPYAGYGGPMGYPSGDPSAPYGRQPVTGEPYSDKQKITAGLLQILPLLVGIPGIGRLYLGYTTIGLVQLIGGLVAALFSIVLIGLPFWIGLCVWSLVDGIMVFTGSLRDPHGRPLRD